MILRFALTQWAWCLLAGLTQALGAPVITGFTPNAGAPGDLIQLNGSGFGSGAFIVRFWNGSTGAVVTVGSVTSDSVMTVAVPNGIITGPISIQQGTGDPLYTPGDFLAIGYGPYITGFSPQLGSVNDTVAILGLHLTNVTSVLFGGTNASQFTPNADGTHITTRVPVGATNGPITVSTLYGTSNSPTAFTVVGAGPYVTDFSPIAGNASTRVQINGLHFTGTTNVTFNGQPGISLFAGSDTLIQVQPPPGVTTGPITVYTSLGKFVTSSNFFGPPVVTGFAPVAGRFNTNVVINGTNFAGVTVVSFGGVPSTNVTVINNLSLTATVPANAGSGLIRVIVPAGSAFSATNFVVAPTISSFSPGFGSSGTVVTITGANLNGSALSVRFNGVAAAPPTSASFSQLVVKVPAGVSTGPISVTTADGSDTSVNPFYVSAGIVSFGPTNAPPGAKVTITGQNFLGAFAVAFGGTAAADFTVSNNTTIAATVPAGVVTGPVSVSTPAGTVTSLNFFYGAPVITSFTPTHGLPGTNVTIKGANFLGGTVAFAGLPTAVLSLNNTQIVVKVPSGAKTGPITVSGPAGTNTSSAQFILDYPAPSLSIQIQAGQAYISWPALSSNYVLESTKGLGADRQWSPVTLTGIISGSVEFIVDTNQGLSRFYRLHR